MIEIRLYNCKRCEEVPILGHLRRFRYFELDGLSNVKSIGLSFYGHGNVNPQEPVSVFPALEELKVWYMQELTGWAAVEGAIIAFPCLKYFEIEKCPKLSSDSSHLPCLKLEVDNVGSNFVLADVCSNTNYLQSIKIKSLSGLFYFPNEVFAKNPDVTSFCIEKCPDLIFLVPHAPSLKELDIRRCETLEELNLHSLESLEILFISGCPEMAIEYVRGKSQGLASLQKLVINNCPRLTHLPSELLESCTSSLQELDLCALDNLEDLRPAFSYLSVLEY